MTERIGLSLRSIRRKWKLSLREVEKRSLLFAEKWGSQSYQISASWLDRFEREDHELAIDKLIVLAEIYNVPPEQLLRVIHAGNTQPMPPEQLFNPNATILLTEGHLEERARNLLADETTLLSTENVPSPTHYRHGIIGKHDRTLDPMIPAGSIVQIDTRMRAILQPEDWTHELQRPIYFLLTQDGYVCGWCELDRYSEWLTLIPHPCSPAASRRWRYRKEIENMGRVIAVAIRLSE